MAGQRSAERRRALLDAAMAFKTEGYSPWPIAPGSKQPLNAGIDSRTWGGSRHRPLTDDEIASVWDRPSPPDLAVVVTEHHFVLDLDPKNNPLVTRLFDELRAATRCAETPSGGLHAFFSIDGSARTIDPALGVDVQGRNALVIVPPSIGRRWSNNLPEAVWSGPLD